jgi:glucose/arabinose dehydrogenase
MPTHHAARLALLIPALSLALAAALTACSSSSSSSSSSSVAASPSASAAATTASPTTATASPSASASTAAATGTAASIAEIKKNWVTFFNGKTPAATRISLVQNGQQFASTLKSMATSAQSETASASVQKVTLTSAAQASVDYTILISGTPMLANQKGTAVLEGGTWKVSTTSFCGLLALQSGGKAVPGCPAS